MNRSARIVVVTAGLMVAGALFGALAANLALALATAATGELRDFLREPQVMQLVGFIGALLGGVLLPSACWLLLRRVPLGLAVLGTLIGTVTGGALGWVLPSGDFPVGSALLAAVAGFAVAALSLRLRFSAPRVPRGAAA